MRMRFWHDCSVMIEWAVVGGVNSRQSMNAKSVQYRAIVIL
jgi:hypothetical protein